MKHGRTTSRESTGQFESTPPPRAEPAKPITFVDYGYWRDGLVKALERVVERMRAKGRLLEQQTKPE